MDLTRSLRNSQRGQRHAPRRVSSSRRNVWTFIEFEGPDEIAGPLANALAKTLLRDGG